MANINKLHTIGSKTLVDFPQFDLNNIPAKVDTGADVSSIWASQIKERSGVLYFKLFDKTSRFYTSNVIKTKDYTITSIKNSFGVSELRHKVRFSIVINGQTIRARFTLSDRSRNQYPVLIGRRTLHGKFVVDVTKDNRRVNSEVLVLTAVPNKTKEKFFKEVSKKLSNTTFTLAAFDDLEFYINQGTVQIVVNGRDIDSFDMVYFKDYLKRISIAVAAAHYLETREVTYFDESVLDHAQANKLFQYVLLCDNNIPIPNTLYKDTVKLRKSYKELTDKLGSPFVLKDIFSDKGTNNYLIQNKTKFDTVMKKVPSDVRYIAQAFIPNDEDYRILVLGKRIKLIIKRQRKSGSSSHLNNTSVGSVATLVDQRSIPYSIKQLSIEAAVLMRRSVAGVDMVKDKTTDTWYCLEVNASPQIVSGAFIEEKRQVFAEFIDNLISK